MDVLRVKKHFFFDMDGTICESRTRIAPAIRNRLNELPNVYVISGARRELMEEQLQGVHCKILAQNGNDTDIWQKKLSDAQKNRIYAHIQTYDPEMSRQQYGDRIEDRGSQISYSFIGHHAPLPIKKSYDPDHRKRNLVLKMHPFVDDELMVLLAGNTTLDYILKDGTKGKNLEKYIADFDRNECIYFGDHLQPGGNDHTVVGIMDTVPADLDTILDILKYE